MALTAQDVFMQIVNAGSVEAIPQGSFADIKALGPAAREEVATALEKLLVAALMKTAFHEAQKPMRALDELERAAIEGGDANRAIMQGIYEALTMVADIRGDDAQLMTRLYIQEVARLPGDERGTILGYAESAARAWSQVVAIEYPDEPKTLDS